METNTVDWHKKIKKIIWANMIVWNIINTNINLHYYRFNYTIYSSLISHPFSFQVKRLRYPHLPMWLFVVYGALPPAVPMHVPYLNEKIHVFEIQMNPTQTLNGSMRYFITLTILYNMHHTVSWSLFLWWETIKTACKPFHSSRMAFYTSYM